MKHVTKVIVKTLLIINTMSFSKFVVLVVSTLIGMIIWNPHLVELLINSTA